MYTTGITNVGFTTSSPEPADFLRGAKTAVVRARSETCGNRSSEPETFGAKRSYLTAVAILSGRSSMYDGGQTHGQAVGLCLVYDLLTRSVVTTVTLNK